MENNINMDNFYISHVFNLNKNKKTNEICVMLRQGKKDATIASITVNENKAITISIADAFKDVYSQEDIEDIVIEKSSKK